MPTVIANTLVLSSNIGDIDANNVFVRDTLVGAYAETEQQIDKVTVVGVYAETEVHQLDVTIVGLYVEVQEDEMVYETVILPKGVGVQYQNVPILTLTRR